MSIPSDTIAQIQELQREIHERQRRLVELKRQAAHQEVDAYTLQGPDGPVAFRELFGDHDDLIVIHNMGKDCSYCTLWADGFNGLVPHLRDRAAFVVVSPDPPDVQQAFARERGWTFPMYSGKDSTFIEDMGFRHKGDDGGHWMPGVSTFRRSPDGTVTRVAKDFFGPGDAYCSLWPLFDLLADGPNGWEPAFDYDRAD